MLGRSSHAISFVLLSAFPVAAAADFLGLYTGVGYWNGDFTGDVIETVDADDELGISKDSANNIYVAFEHPVPLLPNIRLARTSLRDSGAGVLGQNFSFVGQNFTLSQAVTADLDLTYTDLTLYYELWDIGLGVDVGLTARKFSGELQVNQAQQEIDEYLPLVYAAGKVGLPFSGFYLAGDVNGISYSGSRLIDASAKIGWETSSFIFPEFGIEVGYRRFDLNVDQDDADVDVDVAIAGPFIHLVAHF